MLLRPFIWRDKKINTEIQKKTFESGRVYVILNLSGQLVSWLFTFWVIRILEPNDFGLMSMGMVFVNFVRIFASLGLGTGIIQRESVSNSELSSVFWFSLLFGCTLTLLIAYFAYFPSQLFNDPEVESVIQLISLIFVISSFSIIPQNIMARHYEFSKIAKINIWAAVISSFIGVGLALLGYGVYALVYSVLSLELSKAIMFFLLCQWKPQFKFSLHEVAPFFRFGIFLSVSATLNSLTRSIDRMIVGRFFGSGQLGFYSTGMTVADMAIDKASPLFNQLLLPMLSRYSETGHGFRKAYLRALSYYLLLLSPIYVGMILVAQDLIEVLFGDKWIPMVPFLVVFCWINIFRILSTFHVLLFTAKGISKQVSKFSIMNFVVLIPAIAISSMYDIKYVIYSWAICIPLVSLYWILSTLKLVNIKPKVLFKYILRGSLSSVVMLVVVSLTILLCDLYLSSQVLKLIIAIVSGVVSYLSFLVIFQKEMLISCLKFVKK